MHDITTPLRQAGIKSNLDLGAVEFYVSGCNPPHCVGCHNPELWDFENGCDEIDYKRLHKLSSCYDRLFLMGGEPLDQRPLKLRGFVVTVRGWYKELWLFTRYSLNQVPKYCLDAFDYIKTGAYWRPGTSPNVQYYGIRLSTANQMVYKKGVDY